MKKKKLLSILLALVMVATLIPATAFATEESGSEDAHYITMNVPYADFYDAYGVDDAAYYELPNGIDGVSTATTSKSFGSTGGATYNDGEAYILGVTLPVKVSDADYAKLDTSLKDAKTKDYGYTDLETAPAYYSTLAIAEDGSYTFSKLADSTLSANYLSIEPDEDYNESSDGFLTSGYGDYQIAIGGYSTTKGLQTGENEYTPVSLYGAILNVTDTSYTENGATVSGSKAFGMTAGENIWVGSRKVEAQIAWSIKNGKGLHINHNNAELPYYYQFDMNGGTLSSVTLITSEGLIEVSNSKTDGDGGVKLPKYYAGDLSNLTYSINNDEAVLKIDGIPSDLGNAKISVSTGITYLAKEAEAVNGKVALSAVPTAGLQYTLTISSEGFPDITRTLATPIVQSQKDTLQTWINKANATGKVEEDATLKEHVGEATEMIADTAASSYDAATLIDELKLLVKPYFPTATAAATLKGNALAIDLSGVELSALENPTYSLAYRAGRNQQTLASGDLKAASLKVGSTPTVGTAYTLTIVSDNYQNITTTVTAEEADATATVKFLEDAVVSSIDDQTYTGNEIEPTVTVKYGDEILAQGTDYTVAYTGNIKPGTATIDIIGTGEYIGFQTVTFKINAKPVSSLTIGAIAAQTYTGKAITPSVTVKDGATTLTKDTDYTVSYKNNTNAGTATVTITGTGNYTGTKNVTFKINAKAVSGLKVSAIANKAYTGKAIKPAVTVKNGTTTLKSGTDYTVTYKNNTNPGKATVTIKGKGNYTGTKTATFKITPKKATISKLASTKKATLKVTWKKDTKATGYQVVIAKNKKFTSGKKTATITKSKTTSKTFTKLTKGKKYYAKVRAYKTISGKKVYGAYSAVKSKTVKKK